MRKAATFTVAALTALGWAGALTYSLASRGRWDWPPDPFDVDDRL